MDLVQTESPVDSCPPEWPSLNDFEECQIVLKWRDIPLDTYKVLELHDDGRNNYGGPKVVLKLQNKRRFLFGCPLLCFLK